VIPDYVPKILNLKDYEQAHDDELHRQSILGAAIEEKNRQ
jgi:hypothetical protein